MGRAENTQVLSHLTDLVREIEQRDGVGRGRSDEPLATGWAAVDLVLGQGLARGALHEWFGPDQFEPKPKRRNGRWHPPLCILTQLAWQAVAQSRPPSGGWVFWVGPRCQVYPPALIREHGQGRQLLQHSIFLTPPNEATRLWAIELALRCAAVAAVVADGSKLTMAATRRLQLAAEAGGTIALIARPASEIDQLSAATTRWLIQRDRQLGQYSGRSGWTVQLLRCKGMRPIPEAQCSWAVEWDYVEGAVSVPAKLVDRPTAKTRSA